MLVLVLVLRAGVGERAQGLVGGSDHRQGHLRARDDGPQDDGGPPLPTHPVSFACVWSDACVLGWFACALVAGAA
eukprot:2678923-Rhodomonas_salina.2